MEFAASTILMLLIDETSLSLSELRFETFFTIKDLDVVG